MNIEAISLPMSDGTPLALHRMIPSVPVKAAVVLSHGMAEHSLRYTAFGEALNAAGFAFYAGDHRAHGKTAGTTKNLGYLGDSVTFERVAQDVHEVVQLAKKEQSGKKVFLFGHSFGSFIAQYFIEQYGNDIDGCILSGTAGPRLEVTRFARKLASFMCACFGVRHKSRLLDFIAFGSNNKSIKNPKTSSDWLSRDEQEVNTYKKDPQCGFLVTVSFFRELFGVLSTIHTKEAMALIPRSLPIFIFAGDDDPVGSYGETVRALADEYRTNGITDLSLKLYEGGRHEMLNEINRDEVTFDVLSWLNAHI